MSYMPAACNIWFTGACYGNDEHDRLRHTVILDAGHGHRQGRKEIRGRTGVRLGSDRPERVLQRMRHGSITKRKGGGGVHLSAYIPGG
ncbi:hypothetical protein VE04_09660, partial [Pseudogymnoascus sp. 24MN13]